MKITESWILGGSRVLSEAYLSVLGDLTTHLIRRSAFIGRGILLRADRH